MSERILFNDGWEFTKQDLFEPLPDTIDRSLTWTPIDIPHDWLITDTGNLYADGIGWYRKTFTHVEGTSGSRTAIRFEGVYMDCTVFVNGTTAGDWKYGYTTFEFDITGLLKPGLNEMLVRVVYRAPNSRWYTGAGIYRNVWLKTMPAVHFVSDGIYITTRKGPDGWFVDIAAEIAAGPGTPDRGLTAEGTELTVRHSIIAPDGTVTARSENTFRVSGPLHTDSRTLFVKDPPLWDIENPAMHSLISELSARGKVLEQERQTFGFRTILFDSERGFLLNGRHVKLHGVCQHHDLGCLGAAVNRAAIGRQLASLKRMGVNALRTAHNPPAVELMELCDGMGILVCSEVFDMWEQPKTRYDYARFFMEWAQADVASWIRRDRNHPSLIMWSIGNEIPDTHTGGRGQELTAMLMEWVRMHDPAGNARVTLCSNYMPWENAQKCADLVKLAGYNYAEKYYERHHVEHPDWIIYGGETSSIVQSRGIYHFPASQPILADDDGQCSSLGNSATSWGAKSTEACITDDRDAPFSPGMFIWSGFDYIGEPTPYHTKNSYFGQLDTCGFPKDSFYLYQAEWTDYRKHPMIHIFPWWDWNPGQLVDVRVCSNAPEIELFLDGVSLGVQKIDHEKGIKLLAEWRLPYRKGTLTAVARDEKGAVVATACRSSFSDAAGIILAPDKTELRSDGRDLVFVEVSAVDKAGLPVENANNRVQVSVQGAGRLVGLDNGDSTDYDQYKGTGRRLFSGKLLAVVAAVLEPGEIEVEVTSPGLPPARLLLAALPCPRPEGVSAIMENFRTEPCLEIPVRKITLVSPSGTRFDPSFRRLHVQAELSPPDATYRDVEWRVTNDAGIDTNIAVFRAEGPGAEVTAMGDGKFRLRCLSRNGTRTIRLISELEFETTGLGAAYLDPYGFVSGGLHNASRGELGNGNERGVATPRDATACVGFRGLDFGEYGSDELTISLFVLDGDDFLLQIWERLPGEEGSELLADVVYRKPSIWNTYQEETYRLSRKLKGITTLCFVTRRKAHIKGFRFTKPRKAFSRLHAGESSRLYGDSFRISGDTVEDIGNNVSLEFDGMDFGTEGFSKIVICGRSHIGKCAIHIRWNDGNGETVQIAEFPYSEHFEEKEFDLESVSGLQKVSFVFLPGSRFDFRWFRFVK